jgi:hypothetical protein
MDAHCVTLEEHLAYRKTRRRDIKIRIKNEIKKEMGLRVSAGEREVCAGRAKGFSR